MTALDGATGTLDATCRRSRSWNQWHDDPLQDEIRRDTGKRTCDIPRKVQPNCGENAHGQRRGGENGGPGYGELASARLSHRTLASGLRMHFRQKLMARLEQRGQFGTPRASAPGIAPDDSLVPALSEEVRTPPVARPGKAAVRLAHDDAGGSIDDTRHIAATLGNEVHRLPFVVVACNVCGRTRNRLCLELPDH